MPSYDPDKLINHVQDLLSIAGVEPHQITDHRLATTGACMLLRGLGVFPAIDPLDAYPRILDNEPWPETDDQRAAELTRGGMLEKRADTYPSLNS
jgi:hypothetical protein